MGDRERLREFVADDLWLLIGIVTFGLISLAGMAGLGGLAGALSIVGWFVLAPIFLFWGEEIAEILFEDEEPSMSATSEREDDAIDELKRRYAAGEIDDAEFEARLERLVAVEDLPEDLFADGSSRTDSIGDRSTEPGSREPERER
ncbi:SHOCT domain-containing protein [Saliphagus infecundisoli]|uniref:SHOCT domain-containing protein n=1 Tax=Saliphagus infecundisoli TaxID=1849069 RepID=A0ABD5QLI0_9EURY|nr:SHOCT domain-containing protein [Saliphagus infecundisoli]